MRRRDFLAGSAVGAIGVLGARDFVFGQESSNTAKQAFSFAYPLVLMDLTQKAMTGAGGDPAAGFNQFVHYPQATAQFTGMVCPVADSIHSSAWLNVKQEPMIVSVPAVAGRFCSGSFFHAWHDVLGRFGSGSNGGRATDFLVTGPGWNGTVPKGVVHLKSPTNLVWAPVWISVGGAAELAAAATLQSQFRVTPLQGWKGSQPAAPAGGGLAAIFSSFFKPPAIPAGMPAAATGTTPQPPATGAPTVGTGETPAAAEPPSVVGQVVNVGTPTPPALSTPEGAGAADATPGAAGAMAGGLSGFAAAPGGISPNAQLFSMDAATYFTRFCQLMADNPPLEADAGFVAKIAKLGLTAGASLDLTSQTRANQIAFSGATKNAGQKIFTTRGGLKIVTGNKWETALAVSDFGTNYDRRAYTTLMYFGASAPESVLCPRTSKDSTGKSLAGSSRYVLTFARGQMPPVTDSWSLTAYRAPFMELAENPLTRYSLGAHSPLTINPDGSVTIHVQKENPGGEKEANWLPAPEGPFELMLRLYGPKPEVAGLQWKPPAVTKV